MPTTPLLPLPDGLEITAISETLEGLLISVTSHRKISACPLCGTPSGAVHSYYRRRPLDLPCAGQTIRLQLSVRKFFCHVPNCQRKVFTERLPELLAPSSRMTARLRTVVQAIGFAFNGQGGARLSTQLGIEISRPTIIKSLYLVPAPCVGQVKEVGIDDFAWKRGKRYGTIIIDLQTHKILDLLPDREAESVREWLLAHPEVDVISRDRGGAYADGAAQGAPQAIQVADRWHLCKNLGDAIEAYLVRKRHKMPPSPLPDPPQMEVVLDAPIEIKKTEREQRMQAGREHKQEQHEHIQRLALPTRCATR
jgi:transposase